MVCYYFVCSIYQGLQLPYFAYIGSMEGDELHVNRVIKISIVEFKRGGMVQCKPVHSPTELVPEKWKQRSRIL